jgi:NADH-quinone oxidoreductase subunit L
LGLGAGTLLGVTAGMFHLFTHAFFKALLFLAAGSVMHAMGGVIDIRQFGGLRRLLPTTHWTFLFGCLALAGLVPFAGFFSKDLILAAVHEQSAPLYRVLYFGAVGTALLTAFYTFRAFFLTFYGPQRVPAEAGEHAHESPPSMTVPLVVLAAGSLAVGAYFEWTHGFADLLKMTPSLAYSGLKAHAPGAAHGAHWTIAATSTAIVLVGIGMAAVLYLGRPALREGLTRLMDRLGLYPLSHGKFFFDEIYQGLIVLPLRAVAWLSYLADRVVIDGLVNVCGLLPMLVGAALRPLQNGMVQFYALAMVLGLLVLMGVLLM